MVSCQKGPTRHVYAWQIGPFWQDTLGIWINDSLVHWSICVSLNLNGIIGDKAWHIVLILAWLL